MTGFEKMTIGCSWGGLGLSRMVLAGFSLAGSLSVSIIYAARSDWATALTVFPAWVWLIFWLPLLACTRKRIFWLGTAGWLLFALFQVDELPSMIKSCVPAPNCEGSLRVATINCSSSTEPIKVMLGLGADVVLVQENPPKEDLDRLMVGFPGYQLLYGFEASILSKGQIREVEKGRYFTSGVVTVGGHEIFVMSLRLATSDPRIDLWRLSTWKSQAALRKRQMKQIEIITSQLNLEQLRIVGGDFNVPPGDRAFHVLKGKLKDTYAQAGRDWCNTFMAELPVLRLDQIWARKNLTCKKAFVRTCPETDHKAYVAEIVMR